MPPSPRAVLATMGDVLEEVRALVGDETEARRIVGQIFDFPFSAVGLYREEEVRAEDAARALDMAAQRASGVPLQHVLGIWGFRSLDVLVDGRALVPRPETEQVVGFALEVLERMPDPGPPAPVAVDLGTGSGVIALSLAVEGPARLEVWATDRSGEALELAQANLGLLSSTHASAARRLHLGRGDWFDPLPERLRGAVDLVVSNPPYVPAARWERLEPVVRDHDPYEALVPGPSGLEAHLRILDEARGWLAPGGALVLELSPEQAGSLRGEAERRGYRHVEVRPDLAGRDRALLACWPG
jgi:release factor glutamine methyltransferase